MKKFVRTIGIGLAGFGLVSCSALRADDWPSLHEGFQLRADAIILDPSLDIAPQMELDRVDDGGRLSYIFAEAQGLKPNILADEQVFQDFIERIEDPNDIGQQRHWFSAQIALSKLRDTSERLAALLAEAHAIYGGAADENQREDLKDADQILSDLRRFIAAANETLNAKRPESF